jgi:diguanylate cyclase (GGDEF)-like protein/PAS domain S-box-containing protein
MGSMGLAGSDRHHSAGSTGKCLLSDHTDLRLYRQLVMECRVKDPRLRSRTIFIAAAAALATLALVITIASHVLIRRFDTIEVAQTQDKAVQALRALEADLNQLALSTRDYGEWDDAHQYVLTHDPQFLRANFSFDSLDGMHVDTVAVLASNGSLLYGASIDHATATLHTPLPVQFLQTLASLRTQTAKLRSLPSSRRLLRTGDGLMAFSSVEISRSNRTGQNGAILFFGRLLEHQVVQERIRNTSQLAATLSTVVPDQRVWPAFDALTPPVPHVAQLDSAYLRGAVTLHDWHGTPLATLSVVAARNIGTLGRQTTGVLMGTIALLITACTGALLLMLSRLQRDWQQRMALKDRHERILDSLEESIALVDSHDGRIVEANAALLRTLDYPRGEVTALDMQQVYLDVDPAQLADTDGSGLRECRMRARDGHLIDAEINVTSLDDAEPPLHCIVARDVTQRRLTEQRLHESQSRLAHLAEHDELTGLPNRQYLHTHLPKLLHRLASEDRSLALLYVDIDHFKNLNDSRGHALGDQLLKILALRLRGDTSAEDLVLRMSGDEFVIAAPMDGTAGASKALAARILTAVRAPICYEDFSFSFTASIGIAVYPQDGIDGESLLKHADIALFQAKERGRNCYQLFASDMNVQVSEHVLLEQALRRAMNTEQIHIEYQPIIDLQTGQLCSFEALARWRHPELGPIPPGRFIPVAEKSGLIVPLGEQVVRDVLVQLREWQRAGLTLAPVAINVAPLQFEHTDFAAYVHETALQLEMSPRLLAFEVTESALLHNSSKHIASIESLRRAGSRVYIDDFGTGFSNLSYLKNLPVDAVKIDQSFIRGIDNDASDVAIVASVIAVARQLRLDTIAEGIETAAHAERLRELGCKYGQGYYFSRPMPAPLCRALLEQLCAARRFTDTVKTRALRRAFG